METADHKTILKAALVVGIALVLALGVHGKFMSDRNGYGLTVSGAVKKQVTSDLAKWSAAFTRRANLDNLKSVMEQSEADRDKLTKFITKLGIEEKSITYLPLQTNPIYEQLPGYGYTQNVIGYNVMQEVRIESNDVAKIDELASQVKNIVGLGMVPEYQRTEYFYTKLNELRPQLYAEATADAKIRAEAIVKGTGSKIGDLLNARTGIIQITQPNSTDISDYGMYDLSTKEKEITATVSVTFKLGK